LKPGAEKFTSLYPETDPEISMAYAEEIGLGSRAYTITEV
jgi:uncharacterized Fe-S center protein